MSIRNVLENVSRADLAVRVKAAAKEAFARSGLVERTFRLDGRFFVMRFAGEHLANTMTRALQHLATEERGDVSLTINLWDVASTGVAHPMPNWPQEHFLGRGELRGLDCAEMRVAWWDWLKLLNVYIPAERQAYYCLGTASPFPHQQFGSPALTIFNWWLGTHGLQFAHSAAVATEKGGILIIGHGGAGKSTLTFSTLDSPMKYISDDYCVLGPGNPTRAISLYSSGKLTEASLCVHQNLRKHAVNAHDRKREKAIFFLKEQFPEKLMAEAPLRAIVLSKLCSFETALTPIDWRSVAGVLNDSTMKQLAGSGAADFLRLTKFTRGLPVYRLDHGLCTADSHKLLVQLCNS